MYDEEENARYGIGTMYQTMSNRSAIILRKKHFPNGANIVLLSLKDSKECFGDESHDLFKNQSNELDKLVSFSFV